MPANDSKETRVCKKRRMETDEIVEGTRYVPLTHLMCSFILIYTLSNENLHVTSTSNPSTATPKASDELFYRHLARFNARATTMQDLWGGIDDLMRRVLAKGRSAKMHDELPDIRDIVSVIRITYGLLDDLEQETRAALALYPAQPKSFRHIVL